MVAKSKLKRKSKVTESHKALTRVIRHVLFNQGQFKPQTIPNKKRDKINEGFKDEA